MNVEDSKSGNDASATGLPLRRPLQPAAWRTPLILGAIGLMVTLLLILGVGGFERARMPPDLTRFSAWMSLMFLGGFLPRIARRKIFFGSQLTLHRAFSFESVLQGAILLNPQLTYPGVEREFLCRESSAHPQRVALWFRVRFVAAVVIPLGLTATILGLSGRWREGALIFLLCLLVVGAEARKPRWRVMPRWRFVVAVLAGLAAALLEGAVFTIAAGAIQSDAPAWSRFLLYSLLLSGFELSPVPLALGILESIDALLFLVPGLVVPGLAMPVAYRLWRGLPILVLTYFYLPRYKLSIRDLFDPLLPLALVRPEPPGGQRMGDEPAGSTILSVVIPAYNEAERLPRYLPGVLDFTGKLGGATEILVVDDGSNDGTADYVRSVAALHPRVRLISMDSNCGKGAAVRRGMLEAAGKYILFADADGATPIAEAARLLNAAREGAEIVIASRVLTRQDVERTAFRGLLGAVFCRLTNLLALPGIRDTQCGFKLFQRDTAHRLFAQTVESGWAFDVEVLFLAQKLGLSIAEVPVRWREIEGSKISPLRDALKICLAILRIRRRDAGLTRVWRGKEARP
ncbi:MAG: glycosyltransferase family 2 protein [Acidobacteria bacterium]|nr:glycosyltransferase family 2 protein [Acidobacteriota bacterium]